jgi:hypothetical protein
MTTQDILIIAAWHAEQDAKVAMAITPTQAAWDNLGSAWGWDANDVPFIG